MSQAPHDHFGRKTAHSERKRSFFARNPEALGIATLFMALMLFTVGIKSYRPLPGHVAPALRTASFAALFFFIFLVAIYTALKGRPFKRPTGGVLLTSLVTGYFLAAGGILIGNAVLDRHPEKKYRVSILKRETAKDPKGRTYGYLVVSSWRKTGITETINSTPQAPASMMEELSEGDEVEVSVKRGRFGYEWLASLSMADLRMKREPRLKRGDQ